MKTVPVEFLDDLGRLALFENRPAAELEAIVRSRARHPVVLCRMLRIEARRLRTAWGWGT
jgi:hypothetical protein